MDADMRNAVRRVKASGMGLDLLKNLTGDLSLKGLREFGAHIGGEIKNWRGRQVRRAMAMPEEKLMQFTFVAVNNRQDYKLKPTKVAKKHDHIVFTCCFKVKHELSFVALSLYDDREFNFGRQRHATDGAHLYRGDTFNESFILKDY